MKRRTLLGLTALTAGCGDANRRFGSATPPKTQRLVMAIGAPLGTLDPGLSWDIWEPYAIRALFEGLTDYHPATLHPVAALATHYAANSDRTEFTFYLRGHRNPGGIALAGAARGCPVDPARWTNSRPITAHDFVYSWRRVVDPANGFPAASMFYPIRHAQEINAGKIGPEVMSVHATDEFALHVELREPTPFFVQLVASNQFFAVPHEAVEQAGSAWASPGHIINSGAFCLNEWRDGQVVLAANPHYYYSENVRLRELRLISISQPSTTINLYKSGSIDLITPLLPALHLSQLKQTPDFHQHSAMATRYLVLNTRNRPFDNVLVRCAVNMAIDKKEIQRFMDTGSAALTLVPPLDGYDPPDSIPGAMNGRRADILAFDPPGARSLMSAAGFSEGRTPKVEYLYPTQGAHREQFEILQKQLRNHLGLELVPVPKESSIWSEETNNLQHRGISAWADIGLYQNPVYFLDQFLTGASANVTGWSDPRYDAAIAGAKSCADPSLRLKKLAGCERLLLEGRPVVPLYFQAWHQLRKPWVRGIEGNSIDAIAFHRTWVDTSWEPERS